MQIALKHTEQSRVADEVKHFARMTDADLEHYARHTSKRPGLCLLALIASPFVLELLCRIAEAVMR